MRNCTYDPKISFQVAEIFSFRSRFYKKLLLRPTHRLRYLLNMLVNLSSVAFNDRMEKYLYALPVVLRHLCKHNVPSSSKDIIFNI